MGLDLTGIGSVADFAKSLVDRFLPKSMTAAEKAEKQIQLQAVLERRENTVVEAKKSIMIAEVQQGDNFTKRARPSIVYFGLFAIGLVHVIFPIVAWIVLATTGETATQMPKISLPPQFWATWGGVCSIWIIGRSVEKKGSENKLVNKIASLITGGK